MGGAELGDARRSHRLVKLVERLAEQPSLSIPAACPARGWRRPRPRTGCCRTTPWTGATS